MTIYASIQDALRNVHAAYTFFCSFENHSDIHVHNFYLCMPKISQVKFAVIYDNLNGNKYSKEEVVYMIALIMCRNGLTKFTDVLSEESSDGIALLNYVRKFVPLESNFYNQHEVVPLTVSFDDICYLMKNSWSLVFYDNPANDRLSEFIFKTLVQCSDYFILKLQTFMGEYKFDELLKDNECLEINIVAIVKTIDTAYPQIV